LALILLVACIVGVIAVLLMPGTDRQEGPPRPQAPTPTALEKKQGAENPPVVVRKVESKKVAILIDDIGYDPGALKRLLALEAPIAFSVLPSTPHARSSAEAIHRAGKEVLLHLPMEPHGYPDRNPGRGALFASMTAREIRRTMGKALQSVPHAEGANNHMGSKFMEEREPLSVVFDMLHERDLYFVDSVTTDASVAGVLARETGLRFATRDLFIDDSENRSWARTHMEKLLSTSDRWDGLLLIGHPYPETVRALEEMVPRFRSQGIEIVPLSVMVGRKQGPGQEAASETPGMNGYKSNDRNRKP
jgi:polysaccharide deacetylase 2 family uncharacterized protein YibQ